MQSRINLGVREATVGDPGQIPFSDFGGQLSQKPVPVNFFLGVLVLPMAYFMTLVNFDKKNFGFCQTPTPPNQQ